MGQATLHPRLLARQEQLGRALGVDDPTELVAALGAIQTLLQRCGYHLAFARAEREHPLPRRRGSGAESGPQGRPPGSANWASRQLGLGLATLWFEQRGSQPTRRFDAYGSGRPHGPYRDFVAMIWALLPALARQQRKGHVPDVDHFVRLSIDAFRKAQASGAESQRRGLLPESTWNPE